MHEDHTVGERFNAIIAEALRIARSVAPIASAYVLVFTALIALVETKTVSALGEPDAFIIELVAMIVFYGLLSRMVTQSGLAAQGLKNGFGIYLGIAILSGIGIVFGLILLIIPGIVLSIRWSAVYGYAMVESDGVSDALGASWDATRPHFWPIFAAMLLPFALGLISIGILAYPELAEPAGQALGRVDDGVVSWPVSIASNLATRLSSVASLVIGLAVYSLLKQPLGHIREVFE